MGEVIHELALGVFAIEVHATCRLGSIDSVSGLVEYSKELATRLERLENQLDVGNPTPAQNYRFATWAVRQNERMIEAIGEHSMPADAISKARLHAQASRQHQEALKLADQLARLGIESDIAQAAELTKHRSQIKQHNLQTWRRGL